MDAAELPQKRRIGFLKGQIKNPDDFNTMTADEIGDMFYDRPDLASPMEK